MSEQIYSWLAQGGATVTASVALLSGALDGVGAPLVIALAIAVAGPELRAWVAMLWERQDSKVAPEQDDSDPT